ncbi:MAG: type II toxin-antitoxin system HicA family toxin [Candidatus Acidiferrales bacterium]
MAFHRNVWKQPKSLTADDVISALERTGWQRDPSSKGARIGYVKPGSLEERLVIHYHRGKPYGAKRLKELLEAVAWDQYDLKRLN